MSQTKAQLIDTLVASLLPASDSAVDIGSNAVRFANIYGDTLYGSGANLTGLNIVTDTSPQLGGDLQSNGNNILMADNDQIRLGALPDVRFYHDGNHSYLTSATGHFRLRSDSLKIEDQTNGHSMITAVADGAVELYHDNSKKFETESFGATLTGNLDVTSGDVKLLTDNKSIQFGASADLTLLHSGSTGVLNCITGDLHIKTTSSGDDIILISNDDIELQPQAGEAGIKVIGNGAVELYYDNSKKFETTSGGADISNIVQIGTSNDQGELRIGHDGTSYRARLVSNSSNSLEIDADGPERIQLHGGVIYMRPLNSEKSAAFVANGAAELYYDDSKKLETTSAGIDVTGRVTADDLTVENTTGNLSAMFTATNGLGTLEIGGSTGAFIDLKTPQTDDFDLRIGTDGTAGYILAAGTGIISIQGHPTPSANNTYDIGSNTNKWKEIFSTKFIHRYGTSGSATPNEQEAIWYGGGITVMHDNATLSTSNYTWGLTGSRGYALLRIRNNAGSPQAIYAEAGSITSGSDYRMKENIEEITNGIETVKKLKPSIYNIRKTFNPNDDGKKHHGFVAHEVQEAIPDIGNIVSGTKDAMEEVFYEDEDENIPEGKKPGDSTGAFTDNPDYQGIDYGHMTPVLAAAIKELITKVETLESENTSLKTRVTTLESA